LGIDEERPLLKFLESSDDAAARKVDFGLWNDEVKKEYWRRKYL